MLMNAKRKEGTKLHSIKDKGNWFMTQLPKKKKSVFGKKRKMEVTGKTIPQGGGGGVCLLRERRKIPLGGNQSTVLRKRLGSR